jgi:hypothetical protein
MLNHYATYHRIETNIALANMSLARAFQFVTLDGSLNILQNCSISQFVTVGRQRARYLPLLLE